MFLACVFVVRVECGSREEGERYTRPVAVGWFSVYVLTSCTAHGRETCCRQATRSASNCGEKEIGVPELGEGTEGGEEETSAARKKEEEDRRIRWR